MQLRSIRIAVGVVGASALMALAFASTAFASTYLVPSSYPATIIGEPVGNQVLTTNLTFSCSGSALNSEIKSPTQAVAFSPSNSVCKGFYGVSFEASLAANGCKFEVNPSGKVDIGPSGCGPITVTSGTGCHQSIPAKTDVGAIYYTTAESGEYVTAEMYLNALNYTSWGACGTASGEKGSYQGVWTVKAYAPSGSQLGIKSSERLPDGIFLTGTGGLSKLEAERYPVTLNGEQNGTSKFAITTKAGTIACSTANTAGSAAAATGSLSLSPSFSGCTLKTIYGKLTVTIATNGCKYEYGIAGGPSYSGPLSLSCPSGFSMEAKASGGNQCSVAIPSQTLGTATYGASGSGPYRTVTATVSGSNVKSSAFGPLCNATGTFEGGTYVENAIFRGSTS